MTTTFHCFPDMLPEHKNVLMQHLITTDTHCAAIMLASTCTSERVRYQSLGYKWPFAAARLSAARHGYFPLFKWLFEQCYQQRLMDQDYMRATFHAVYGTSNIELFRWYSGPGFYFAEGDLWYLSWEVFVGVFGDAVTEQRFYDILSYTQTAKWGLHPFYYILKRFGRASLCEHFERVLSPLGQCGTFQDIHQLDLVALFDEEPSRNLVPLLHAAISHGNTQILNAIAEHWPESVKRFIKSTEDHYYVDVVLVGSTRFSISLLETCARCGLAFDRRAVIKKYVLNNRDEITPEIRALLEYGGWSLPADVKTAKQCCDWLDPGALLRADSVCVVGVRESFINAL